MSAPPADYGAPCLLGRVEYDGARYCHEHGGFLEAGRQSRLCDRSPLNPTRRRDLPPVVCDTTEPRP